MRISAGVEVAETASLLPPQIEWGEDAAVSMRSIPAEDTPEEWKGKTWTLGVAFAFGINYIMGIGVLSTPYAFSSAGLILSVGTMMFATALCFQTGVWVLETMARAETLVAHGFGGIESSILPRPELLLPKHMVTFRKFEVNEMIRLFFGQRWDRFYTVLCIVYLWGALWGYAAIFCNSLMAFLPFVNVTTNRECVPFLNGSNIPPQCWEAYRLYLLIFGGIVIPICCKDLTGQKIIQIVLNGANFACMSIMVLTLFLAIFLMPRTGQGSSAPFVDTPRWVDFGQFELIFSTCIFSQIVHHSIPGISQPVRNKKLLRTLFGAIMMTTFAIYCLLSCLATLYFGQDLKKILTLEWLTFPFNVPASQMPWWGRVLSGLIVFLPVIQVTSCYPLNAITAGNNLYFSLPAHIRSSHPFRYKIFCRLATAIPPIVAACFVRDLSEIVMYTGLLGFFISLTIPALLQRASFQLCEQTWGAGSARTMYSTPLSSPIYTWIVVAFSVVCITTLLLNSFLNFI